jgi:hypothetical protein
MPLKEIGIVLLVLIVIFLFGQLWFHLVEAVLNSIKKLFNRRRKPPAWHPFPSEKDDE